jgi:hypothetical protein
MSKPGLIYAACHDRTGGGWELLNEERTEKQLRFMMRVKRGQPTTIWLGIVNRLLELGDQQRATGNPAWTIDISKQYFRKPDLKYGWRIILQGPDLPSCFEMLANEIRKAQAEIMAVEIQEVKLHGSPNRSKTAGLFGHVPIGPLAMQNR